MSWILECIFIQKESALVLITSWKSGRTGGCTEERSEHVLALLWTRDGFIWALTRGSLSYRWPTELSTRRGMANRFHSDTRCELPLYIITRLAVWACRCSLRRQTCLFKCYRIYGPNLVHVTVETCRPTSLPYPSPAFRWMEDCWGMHSIGMDSVLDIPKWRHGRLWAR